MRKPIPKSRAEKKLEDDLEYRLPTSNKPIGTIVFPRELAEELLTLLRDLRSENEELRLRNELSKS